MVECKEKEQPASDGCPAARGAAKEAVRQVFAILGVDVDDPEKVEEFRKDLRLAGTMRRAADKGLIAFVLALVAFTCAALVAGFKIKLGGG